MCPKAKAPSSKKVTKKKVASSIITGEKKKTKTKTKRGGNGKSKSAIAKGKYINDDNNVYFKATKNNGYQWLSNFWPFVNVNQSDELDDVSLLLRTCNTLCTFVVDDITYSSVEHYYQSMKYAGDASIAKDIRDQSTAVAAKKRNTHYKKKKPLDMSIWNDNRDTIMLRALTAKFRDNIILGQLLGATGDRQLHEVPGRNGDKYWTGGEHGHNRLGQLLMIVRTSLQQQTKTPTLSSTTISTRRARASGVASMNNDDMVGETKTNNRTTTSKSTKVPITRKRTRDARASRAQPIIDQSNTDTSSNDDNDDDDMQPATKSAAIST